MKKDKTISVRLSNKLAKKLEKLEKLTGLSQAEIIRFLIFRADDDLNIKKIDVERIRELSKIGVNINQIAKHLNTYKENADTRKHLRALEEINKLLQILEEILR